MYEPFTWLNPPTNWRRLQGDLVVSIGRSGVDDGTREMHGLGSGVVQALPK